MSSNDLEKYFKNINSVDDLYTLAFQSRGWFRSMLRQLRKHPVQHKRLAYGDPTHNTKRMDIGKLYLFEYEAKYKEVLPIWDKFPLVLPFSFDGKTIFGINLHYLPHKQRAWLLYQIEKIYNLKKKDTETANLVTRVVDTLLARMGIRQTKLSWSMLSNMNRVDVIGNGAVKRYLPDHIKSPLRAIPHEDWAKIILLPFEVFVEKNKTHKKRR